MKIISAGGPIDGLLHSEYYTLLTVSLTVVGRVNLLDVIVTGVIFSWLDTRVMGRAEPLAELTGCVALAAADSEADLPG